MKSAFIVLIKAIIVLLVLILVYVSYAFAGGFRDYEKYCTGYIDQLDNYHELNGSYPALLSVLEEPVHPLRRYKSEQCGYSVGQQGYTFFTTHGFIGVAIYQSQTGEWVYD